MLTMAHFAARLRVAERADSLCEIDVLPLARSDVEGSRSAVEVSLAERCAGCLTVTAFWHTGALHPLAVLSLATGGWASCVAVISPRSGAPSATVAQEQEGGSAQQHHLLHGLARLHAECTAATKTAVAAPLAPGRELHRVAVPGATRFWCANNTMRTWIRDRGFARPCLLLTHVCVPVSSRAGSSTQFQALRRRIMRCSQPSECRW